MRSTGKYLYGRAKSINQSAKGLLSSKAGLDRLYVQYISTIYIYLCIYIYIYVYIWLLTYISTLREIDFRFVFNDGTHSFPFVYEPNGIAFGSLTKRKNDTTIIFLSI